VTWWQRLVSSHPSPSNGTEDDVRYGRSLKSLADRLKKLQHPRLLDLGHTCGANIDYFVQLGCKVHVDDYASSLMDRPQPDADAEVGNPSRSASEEGFPSRKKKTMPEVHIPPVEYEAAQFDVILCWDLFDYVTVPEATALAHEIDRVAAPGGLLLALFGAAGNTLPRSPRRYRIESEQSIRAQSLPGPHIVPQHLPNREIARLFNEFEISQTVLLKNGTREMMLQKRQRPRSRLQEPRMVSLV
jgi:SAM-dependent methyltransferase